MSSLVVSGLNPGRGNAEKHKVQRFGGQLAKSRDWALGDKLELTTFEKFKVIHGVRESVASLLSWIKPVSNTH